MCNSYNDGQRKLMMNLSEFMLHHKKNVFKLIGGAGTGKTYCLSRFILKHQQCNNIVITAPTHKALQVLRQSIKNDKLKYVTIHRCLGYEQHYDKEGKSTPKFDLSNFNHACSINEELPTILIIDEISMISDKLFNCIKELHTMHHFKLILTGDSCQLPSLENKMVDNKQVIYPKISNIFNYYNFEHNLTEIQRTDKKILCETYQIFRDYVLFNDYEKFLTALNHIKKQKSDFVKFTNKNYKFEMQIMKSFKQNQTAVIASSNEKVQHYNDVIHEDLYPKSNLKWHVDQGVYFTSFFAYIKDDISSKFYTSQQCKILEVEKSTLYNSYFKKTFNVIKLKLSVLDIEGKQSDVIDVHVHHPEHEEENKLFISNFRKKLKEKISRDIKTSNAISKAWVIFYFNKKCINCPITFSYCTTTYKAQGSTYDNVFIDMDNILMCRSRSELQLTRELYTAISRAKHKLYLLLDLDKLNDKKTCSRCRCTKSINEFQYNEKSFKLCSKCRSTTNKSRKKK